MQNLDTLNCSGNDFITKMRMVVKAGGLTVSNDAVDRYAEELNNTMCETNMAIVKSGKECS